MDSWNTYLKYTKETYKNMIKNQTVDSVDSRKEFDRSVCFTFFESYLEQGELINQNLGAEMCSNYFIALCKYALYQEEPDDMMIKILITGLKNTIDAGQNKRAKSFKGEDIDMTNKILEYKTNNPEASYRQIANALGCSKSKVGKVLSNSNSNINYNSNLNSNYNTVDVDVDTTRTSEESTKEEQIEKKERVLEDLSDEELNELLRRYRAKEKYSILQKDFNLQYGILSKELPSQIESILKQRKEDKDKREHKEAMMQLGFSLDEDITLDMAHRFATEILKYKISKEDMQEDMDIHSNNGQSYTWKDFVYPPKHITLSNFYDYTARLCSLLEKNNT